MSFYGLISLHRAVTELIFIHLSGPVSDNRGLVHVLDQHGATVSPSPPRHRLAMAVTVTVTVKVTVNVTVTVVRVPQQIAHNWTARQRGSDTRSECRPACRIL